MNDCPNPDCCHKDGKEDFDGLSRERAWQRECRLMPDRFVCAPAAEVRAVCKKVFAGKKDPNCRPGGRLTLLQVAVLACLYDEVSRLLEDPRLDVNAASTEKLPGMTALHLAARHGEEELVELLLTMPDVNVNAVDAESLTPLLTAIVNGHAHCATLLLHHPKVDIYYETGTHMQNALFAAVAGRQNALVSQMLTMDKNVNKLDMMRALAVAAYRGDPLVMRVLLDRTYGKTHAEEALAAGLEMSSRYGHADLLRILLVSGADPDILSDTDDPFLLNAARGGRLTAVQALLADPRVDPNVQHPISFRTALHIAVEQNDIQIVRALLAHPQTEVNIERMPALPRPIVMAAFNGRLECAQMLLARSDIDLSPHWDDVSLQALAASSGNAALLRLMLDRVPGDVNLLDTMQQNALTRAVVAGNEACVAMLLAHDRVNVNFVRAASGRSALMMAISSGSTAVVKAFLACPRVTVSKANADFAAECGYTEMVPLIEARIAQKTA